MPGVVPIYPLHPGADTAMDAAAVRALKLPTLPPLALYLHLPWCLSKCPYCDFNSHVADVASAPDWGRYVDALVLDLERCLPRVWGRTVSSVFLGGGTPSLFPPPQLARLLAAVRARLPLLADAEITIEANPNSLDAGRLAALREAGINRLSLGAQSFDDGMLARLGRTHDRAQLEAAIVQARASFDNWNLDLMFALPGQTLAMLEQDLQAALQSGATHLSCYQLTLESGTRFAQQPPASLPDADLAADMQQHVVERLAEAGYARYEVSAYARAGYTCRHNLNYWNFGDYLGLGAGAHAKLSYPDRITREERLKQPEHYMELVERTEHTNAPQPAALPPGLAEPATSSSSARMTTHETVQVVRDEALPFEFMLGALRLSHGFAPQRFTERTGLPWAAVQRQVDAARQRGLLEWVEPPHHLSAASLAGTALQAQSPLQSQSQSPSHSQQQPSPLPPGPPEQRWLRPTELGYRFLSDVLQMFL